MHYGTFITASTRIARGGVEAPRGSRIMIPSHTTTAMQDMSTPLNRHQSSSSLGLRRTQHSGPGARCNYGWVLDSSYL